MKTPLSKQQKQVGFTLLEILVVIAIIGILASISIVSYSGATMKARDSKRIIDIRNIESALYDYLLANGTLPDETTADSGSLAGWEVSYLPNFMEYLAPYMRGGVPFDPRNTVNGGIDMFFTPRSQDNSFFYNYYFYNWADAGDYYGCSWHGPFAILGFRAYEKADPSNLPKAKCGPQPCPRGGIAYQCRDWSTEFDYSVFIVAP